MQLANSSHFSVYLSFYLICFDGGIDAELFSSEKSAIFLILPDEDTTKNFVASLMIQDLARELFSVANEFGGFAPNSKTAETLSKNMGNRTVLSGQVSHSTKDATEMLQMMQRPLMTADELKFMSNGRRFTSPLFIHPNCTGADTETLCQFCSTNS